MDPIMPLLSAEGGCISRNGGDATTMRTLFDHLLDRACWIDLHGVEVLESIHFGGVLRELLAKSIGQVMRRIRRLRQESTNYSRALSVHIRSIGQSLGLEQAEWPRSKTWWFCLGGRLLIAQRLELEGLTDTTLSSYLTISTRKVTDMDLFSHRRRST